MKERLDSILVSRGIVSGRDRAKAVIMAGQVYIDGQKVKTFSVGDCQLATNVKHGEHTIKMVYTPKGLRLGIAISALAWLLIIVGAVLSKILKRRKFDTGFDEKI